MWDTNSGFRTQSSDWWGLTANSGFLSTASGRSEGSNRWRVNDPAIRRWQSLSCLPLDIGPRLFSGNEFHPKRRVEDCLQDAHTHLENHLELLRSGDTRLKKQRPAVNHEEREMSTMRRLLREAEERLTEKPLIQDQMNQRIVEKHADLQDLLTKANNKISQAYLDKASLSTQVLKLEVIVRELEAKVSSTVADQIILENSDMKRRCERLEVQLEKIQQDSKLTELQMNQTNPRSLSQENTGEGRALKEINEKLVCELEMLKQRQVTSQNQLQELTTEKLDLVRKVEKSEDACLLLTKEKEELLSKTEDTETMDQYQQLRCSCQKLEDQCRGLEAEVLRKDENLHQLKEECHRRETVGVQDAEELEAVISHWTEKWQRTALTLQRTQEELEEMKRWNNKESRLGPDLNNCDEKPEGRSLQRNKDGDGVYTAVPRQDNRTQTNTPSQTKSMLSFSPQLNRSSTHQTAADKRIWHLGLMPVHEEDEENEEQSEMKDKETPREMPAVVAHYNDIKAGKVGINLQHCPDGLFLAECVTISSPDEEEEDENMS